MTHSRAARHLGGDYWRKRKLLQFQGLVELFHILALVPTEESGE